MKIEANIPALRDKDFSARITKLSPYISPETKNFETVCEFEGDTSYIRPGMFIELVFVLNEKTDVWKLPYEALIGGETLWYVDDGVAKSMEYLPNFGSEEEFEITDEYASRLFIVEGQHFLTEGHEIRILNEKMISLEDGE